MNENELLNELRSILLPGASWTDIFDRLDEIKPSKYEREIEKVQIYSGTITGPNVHFFSRHPNQENFPIYKCPKCKKFLKREAVPGHMRRKHSTINGTIHTSSSLPSMTSTHAKAKPSSSACASTASSSSACSASPSTSNHSDPSSSSPTDNSNSSDILEQESLLKLKVRLQKKRARSRDTSFTENHPPVAAEPPVLPPIQPTPSPPPSQPIPQSIPQSSLQPPPPQESRSPRTAKMLGCYLIASTSSSRAKSRSPGPLRVKPPPVSNTVELKEPSKSRKKIEKFIRRTRNSSMRSLLDIEEVELIKEPRRNFNRMESKPEPPIIEEPIERAAGFKISQDIYEKPPGRSRFFEKQTEKLNRRPEIPQQCQLEMQKPSMSGNLPVDSIDLGPATKRRREVSEDEMIDVTTNSPINEHFEDKVEILTVDDDDDDGDGENRRPSPSIHFTNGPQSSSRHSSGHLSRMPTPTPSIPLAEPVNSPIPTFRSKAELKEIPKREKKENNSSAFSSRIIHDISPPNIEDGNSMDSNHTEPMYSERHSEEPKREGSAPILEQPGNEEKEETRSSIGPSDDVDDGPPVLFPQIDAYALEDETVDLADLDGIILTPFDVPSTSNPQHCRPIPKIAPQTLHQPTLSQSFHSFTQPSTSFQLVHPQSHHLPQPGASPQLVARPMAAHPQIASSSMSTSQQAQVSQITVAPGGQPRKVYFQQPQIPVQRSPAAVVLVHPPSSGYSQQFQVVGRETEWTNAGLPSNGMAPLAQAAVASSLQGPTAYPYTSRPAAAAPPIAFTADIRVIGADGTEYRYAPQPVRPRMTNYIALQSPHLVHLQPGHGAGPSQLAHSPHPTQPQLIQPVQQIMQPAAQPVPIEPSPYLFIRSHDTFPQYPGETGWEQTFEPLQQTVPIDIRPQQVYAVHMPTSRVTEASRIRPE